MMIGIRLKELRQKLKLTQKELAKKIEKELDHTYIGKIEREEQNPSLNVLKRIADSLNINMEYFFTDKPMELYLASESNNNKKRNELMAILSNLDEEELNFTTEIIRFLQRYKNIRKDSATLKAAEPRKKYKA